MSYFIWFQWATFAVTVVYIALYFRWGASAVNDAKRASGTEVGGLYGKLAIAIGAGGAAVTLTQIFTVLGIIKTSESLIKFAPVGFLLFSFGIAAAFYIRFRRLGKFWSGSIEIQEGHKIQKEGIYSTIRHPLYAVTTFTYTGALIAFPYWWNAIVCVGMIAGYVVLTVMEDRHLIDNLPGYKEYAEKTRFLWIPGIW